MEEYAAIIERTRFDTSRFHSSRVEDVLVNAGLHCTQGFLIHAKRTRLPRDMFLRLLRVFTKMFRIQQLALKQSRTMIYNIQLRLCGGRINQSGEFTSKSIVYRLQNGESPRHMKKNKFGTLGCVLFRRSGTVS